MNPPWQSLLARLGLRLIAALIALVFTLLTIYLLASLALPLLRRPELDRPDMALTAMLGALVVGLLLLALTAARLRRKPRPAEKTDGNADHPH